MDTDQGQLAETLETGSQTGSRSVKSNRSAGSSAATKAKAKAEAFKVKIAYAEKEAAVLKEKAQIEERKQKMLTEAARRQADMEAELNVLQLQREATAASRESEVYQAATEWEDEHRPDFKDEDRAQCGQEYLQHTREYVQNTPVQYALQPFTESHHTHREPCTHKPWTS